jgi:hypothetical protein
MDLLVKTLIFSMKRSVSLLLLFLLVASHSYAQKAPWQKVVTINTGVSVPFSDYSDKTFSYHSGYANPGTCIESNFLFYREWFAFSAALGYSNQSFAKKKYVSSYNEVLNNIGITSVSAGIYQSMKVTAGFAFRLLNMWDTELFWLFQAGTALNVHPEIQVTNSYWGEINYINRDADWQSTSVIGLILKHNLTDNIGITLSYNANYTLPGFRDENNPYIHYYNLPMRFQNITVGVFKNL